MSVNAKRGLRQKVRRGEMPGVALIGYYNDMRTKTVKVDKKIAPIIKQAFELYARGDKRLDEVADFLYQHGIHTKSRKLLGKQTTGKKPFHKNRIKLMLTNPFYYGHFRYLGEIYEGKHTPIISKRLFDDVQNALERRGKPQKVVKEPWPFCGLIHCSCGMMLTNERQVKRQKNGNVYVYDYYRCTRKNKAVACKEPHIRAEELDKQLSNLLLDFAMPTKWADKLYELIRQDEQKDKISFNASISKAQEQIVQLSSKLQRLLDGYLDGDVERELYQIKRAEILGEKKRLQEQIEQSSLGVLTWVEPIKKWIETAVSICKIAKSDDLAAKKSLCLETFGSNLKIQNKNVVAGDDQFLHSPQKNIWLWLRQSLEKAARSGDQISESSILVLLTNLDMNKVMPLIELRQQLRSRNDASETTADSVPVATPKRAPHRRLSKQQRQEALERYHAGQNYTEIGRELGVHRATIAEIIKRNGEAHQRRMLSSAEQTKAKALHASGVAFTAIAGHYGVVHDVLSNCLTSDAGV